ncbi:ankyrin repeat domain-containing protein [Dehalococcoides mccartyi]|nr:ankyrin repeat domain-containing protein [Dehalococcoides mccartyi]
MTQDSGILSSNQLTAAIEAENLDEIRNLIRSGTDPSATDSIGNLPLCLAVEKGKLSAVRILLEAGANPNDSQVESNRGVRGCTPLVEAVNQQNLAATKMLITGGAESDRSGSDGWTPLTWAAASGYVDIVSFLIDQGVDPSFVDSKDVLPMSVAVDNGHYKVVEALIAAGMNINRGEALRLTESAAKHGDLAAIIHSIDTFDFYDEVCLNALDWASVNGHLKVVAHIVAFVNESEIDINENTDSLTLRNLTDSEHHGHPYEQPLWVSELCGAAINGHLEVTKLLAKNGSTVSAQHPEYTVTPLIGAIIGGHIDIAKFLLDAGADPNELMEFPTEPMGTWFWSALGTSINMYGTEASITELLQTSGATKITSYDFNSPLMPENAQEKSVDEMLLISLPGSMPFLKDLFYRVILAADIEMCRYLIQNGALEHFPELADLIAEHGYRGMADLLRDEGPVADESDGTKEMSS